MHVADPQVRGCRTCEDEPMGGEDADDPGGEDDRRDDPQVYPARRRWRGGRLLLALVVLLVAGLVTWSLLGPAPGDSDADGPDDTRPTDVALLGPDLDEAGVRLDDDGDPPSAVMGLRRTQLAEVDAQDRSAHVTLDTSSQGMELARFAVLWCDMPPAASRGIEVPTGTITVREVEIPVPCAGRDGTPPVRQMVPLPLEGTAVLDVAGDLPSAGSATLAVYTEPTDGSPLPFVRGSDSPAPAVPPGAVALEEEHAIPALFDTVRTRLVQISSGSQIRVHAASTGSVRVDVDGVPVTDDGDVAGMARLYELMSEQPADGPGFQDVFDEVRADLWRTQQPDLREGRWVVYVPGSQRTFPVPESVLPADGQRRTVAVSVTVTVEGDLEEHPQVVVTDALEVAPPVAGDLEPQPLPLDGLGDEMPAYVQGTRLSAAWRVRQDGLLRTLPDVPAGDGAAPWLVGTWSGSPTAGLLPAPLLGGLSTGTVLAGDEAFPLMVVNTSTDSLADLHLGGPDDTWSFPVEDRWRLPAGEVAVVLPAAPGLPDANVLAYLPVSYDEFDFTDAPAPSSSWPADGDPPWSPLPPPPLDTLTESDLEDGRLTLELDDAAASLWITTRGPGRMELLRDGQPLLWEAQDGWWSSWTDRAVTSDVHFPPVGGTLQVRVEGYEEGFRVEVHGQP